MKKYSLLILVLATVLLLGACGSRSDPSASAKAPSSSGREKETAKEAVSSASEDSSAAEPGGSAAFVRFRSDIADIHIDQAVRVTFYATVSPESSVTEPVVLERGAGGILGELKDDGVAPDEAAHDRIYTGTFELKSAERKNEVYRAVCGKTASDPVTICYYRDLTQQDFDQMDSVLDKLGTMSDFSQAAAFLSSHPDIEQVGEDSAHGSITFTTAAGLTGVWVKAWDGQGKGGAASLEYKGVSSLTAARSRTLEDFLTVNKNIAVIRPFRSTDFQYDLFKDWAEGITDELGGTVTVMDDGAATLECMKTLDEYGMVFFDTHGVITFSGEPYLVIGETADTWLGGALYDEWWQSILIVVNAGQAESKTADRHLAVGAKFFDHYYEDGAFDETLFFLGSCYSMHDYSIAEVLKNKGTSAIFGYSDPVTTSYCNNTFDGVMSQLAFSSATAGEAYERTRSLYGEKDPCTEEPYNDTYFLAYGNSAYRLASKLSVLVRDRWGKTVPGAQVNLLDTETWDVYTTKPGTESDALYAYLPAGRYAVTVTAEHFLKEETEVSVSGETGELTLEIILKKRGELECYVLEKHEGMGALPLAGVTLTMTCGENTYSALSGEDGHILLQDMEEGSYDLEFVLSGYKTVRYTDIVIEYDEPSIPPYPIEMERDGSAFLLAKVGDEIEFGRYEQDNDLKNGEEPIRWKVIAIEDGKALVISSFALDSGPYNTEYTAMTWENCSLRKWLNEDFLSAAFTEEEQGYISVSHLVNNDNPVSGKPGGNDTEDRIFLLSIEEAETYFGSDEERQCWTTAYALARQPKLPIEEDGCCWWWLRSVGGMPQYAVDVMPNGSVRTISGANVNVIYRSIRPAFWISLDTPGISPISENIHWTLKDGVLTISGTGDMEDYNNKVMVPWYQGRNAVRTVIVEEGITHIGKYAFFGMRSLTSVSLPGSLLSIGDQSFYLCDRLTALTIPEGVTGIGYQAVCGCSGLVRLTLPDSLASIAEGCFTDCSSLTAVRLPEGLEKIGSRTFMKCYDLKEVEIPDSVKIIDSFAFTWCRALTGVRIPEGVTLIGSKAFWGCSTLKEITIPKSVTSIGKEAFLDCEELSDIYYGGSEAEWNGIFSGTLPEKTVIHYNSTP